MNEEIKAAQKAIDESIDAIQNDLAASPNVSVEDFQIAFNELENERQVVKESIVVFFNFLNSQE
jgi:hypothetical protein